MSDRTDGVEASGDAPARQAHSGDLAAIEVVIPWRDRPEIAHTLAANLDNFNGAGCQVTIANCGGDQAWLARVLLDVSTDRSMLRMASFEADHFNKCLALNLAVVGVTTPSLLFLDADIVLEPDTILQMTGALEEGTVVTVARVRESGGSSPSRSDGRLAELAWSIEVVDEHGRRACVETNRVYPTTQERAAPGLILLSRDDFLAVGGMNSQLVGWGWEDIDLLARLSLGLGLQRRQAGSVAHLSHSDQKRSIGEGGRHRSEARNRQAALDNYATGRLQGTLEADSEVWADRIRIYQ